MMQYLWAGLGLICVALAMIGIALPLLPTVPFLLLAAFFFARSSARLHNWLITQRTFGPMILDWLDLWRNPACRKKSGDPVGRRCVWDICFDLGPGPCPDHSGRGSERGHDLYLDPP